MKALRSLLGIATVIGLLSLPSLCRARDEPPSIISYGFKGFWNGALIGLGAGYLSTGSEFESGEWRNLAFGAGIGALSGLAFGITLGVVDSGKPKPTMGWLILRDVGYGVTLGALAGTAVGALFLIDSGRPKDLLIGASVGGLIGAAAGIVFGVIEGNNAQQERRADARTGLRLTLLSVEGAPLPVPGISARF